MISLPPRSRSSDFRLIPRGNIQHSSRVGCGNGPSLARAMALDPELLFLDEPTSGLDPQAADAFNRLIKDLQTSLNLTVFLVTHDLDTLFLICDRIAIIVDKKARVGTIDQLLRDEDSSVREYLQSSRARAALELARKQREEISPRRELR